MCRPHREKGFCHRIEGEGRRVGAAPGMSWPCRDLSAVDGGTQPWGGAQALRDLPAQWQGRWHW
jgi:hypothetical protein